MSEAPKWTTSSEDDFLPMTIGEYVLKYMGERTARAVYGDAFVEAALRSRRTDQPSSS